MSNRPVTFANFRIGVDSVESIGAMPDPKDPSKYGPGVGEQMAIAFDTQGRSWGDLIGAASPNRDLQQDIAHATAVLEGPAQERFAAAGLDRYVGKSALEITTMWGADTRLLEGVERPYQVPGAVPGRYDFGIEPERVLNWLDRMGDTAIVFGRKHPIDRLLLPTSVRPVGADARSNVPKATAAAEYMKDTMLPRLVFGQTREELRANTGEIAPQQVFGAVSIVETSKNKGDEVMRRMAEMLQEERGVDLRTAKVVVFSVAGNWIQTGGQTEAGLQHAEPEFNRDPQNPQLVVVCDPFQFGVTGEEPKTTHQHPVSGSANIPRGFLYLEQAGASRA